MLSSGCPSLHGASLLVAPDAVGRLGLRILLFTKVHQHGAVSHTGLRTWHKSLAARPVYPPSPKYAAPQQPCELPAKACRPFLCQISSSHDLASQRKPKTTHSRLQNTQERRAPGRRSPSSCSTPDVETAPAPAKSCTHAHRRMSMLSTTRDTLATA